MTELKRSAYAKEAGHAIREGKKIGFNLYLERAKAFDVEDPSEGPYMFYKEPLSRVEVVMTDTTSSPAKICKANITIDQLESVFLRTEYALQEQIKAETETADAAPGSDAYTVKLTGGKGADGTSFAGKTPAEILLASPDARDALRDQYKYLKANLEKYPRNKQQMDAICEAVNLLDKGELQKGSVSTTKVIKLYDAEARALIRKKREDGFCPVYEIHIKWTVGEKMPVTVSVSNFYAPVKEFENGRINPVVSSKDPSTNKSLSMKLTESEWLYIKRTLEADLRSFEEINAKTVFAEAEKADAENRAAAVAPRS